MTIRAVIVDDEAPARDKIRRLLASRPEVVIVGEAENGEAAVEEIANRRPDVVFLDIQMPGMTGLEVLEYLTPPAPRIVFVTAYDQHAVKAFEKRALDYLLKPVTAARLSETIDRLLEPRKLTGPGNDAALAGLTEGTRPDRYITRLLVRHGERIILLRLDQVDYIEAQRNRLHFVSSGRRFTQRASLQRLESRLDPDAFLQINRSQIVRLDAIAELEPWSHGDYRVVLRDGTRLSWSRRFRATQDATAIRRSLPHRAL